jgi:cytoskeletal protein CcmA (bactofilin family)
MFSKQVSKNGRSSAAVAKSGVSVSAPMETGRRPLKVASMISEDLVVTGGLTSEGDVHVDGRVQGEVKVARLTLGETGHIEGSVTCDTIEVRGRVIGPISAKVVRLFSTSHVDGDITHEQLAMESGAFFQGRSLKLRPTPPVPTTAPSPMPSVISLPQPAVASVN